VLGARKIKNEELKMKGWRGGNKKGAKYFLPLRRKLNVCVGLCPTPNT